MTCASTDYECQIKNINHYAFKIYDFQKKFTLFANVVIIIVSLIILVRVTCIHKRCDWFLILTPAFYLVFGILSFAENGSKVLKLPDPETT